MEIFVIPSKEKGENAMPTETFFRLPDSKRERILQAIKEEIARSPYEDFSIGVIVRECGISRGSFYQYFKNKEDIYLYLLSGYQSQIFNFGTKKLLENGGDFFAALEDTYRFAVRMLCYKDSKAFRHNLFCNMRLVELVWQRVEYAEEQFREVWAFRDAVDRKLLNVQNEAEFSDLFNICMISGLKELGGIFITDDNEQTVLDRYLRKLALLRRVFAKRPE